MGKLVITNINNNDILFGFDDNFNNNFIKVLKASYVDSVYIGRIDEINKGLNCAFVAISKEQKVFLSLNELKENYKCGDELPVQIKVDPLKTKLPQAGTDICFPGEYCVVHLEGDGIGVSRKLPKEQQNKLLSKVKNANIPSIADKSVVIRTNAASLLDSDDINPLIDEINELAYIADQVKKKSKTLKLYSKLYQDDKSLLSALTDIPYNDYDSIITDNSILFDNISSSVLLSSKEVKLYTDTGVSLTNLYSLKTHLGRALDSKVYLQSGGYLIIEPTEAMTVIDVNSGKANGNKKNSRDYIFKINKEAALEVARQLKIRNISGIIMVDFINMPDEDNSKLLNILNEELSKDKIYSKAIDMTPLGIVEITRKKVNLSLDKAISL